MTFWAKPHPSQIRFRRGHPRSNQLIWASACADLYGPHFSGTTYPVRDAVKNWHGSVVDSDGTLSTSPWGRSLFLTGVSTANSIPYKADFDVSRFSIGLLINSPVGAGSILQYFSRDDGGAHRVWQFRLNAGKVEAILFFGGSPTTVTGTTDLRDGQWHHIAVTYDRVNIKVYADGKEEGTSAKTTALDTSPWLIQLSFSTGAQNAARYSDMKLWSRGLSPSEIKEEYADPFELYLPPTSTRFFFALPAASAASASATEAHDTLVAPAVFKSPGAIAKTEAHDSLTSGGVLNVSGHTGSSLSGTVTEGRDTLVGQGAVPSPGVLTATEAHDTLVAAAAFAAAGVLARTGLPDTLAAIAAFSSPGAIARTERPDVLVAPAVAGASGSDTAGSTATGFRESADSIAAFSFDSHGSIARTEGHDILRVGSHLPPSRKPRGSCRWYPGLNRRDWSKVDARIGEG